MRLMIDLRPDEEEALLRLARRERRHPRAQAAIAVREELERLGLLTCKEMCLGADQHSLVDLAEVEA